MLLRGFAIADEKGGVKIPLHILARLGVGSGDKVEFKLVGGGGLKGGQIKVQKVQRPRIPYRQAT